MGEWRQRGESLVRTIGVAWALFMFYASPLFGLLLTVYLLTTVLWPLIIVYLIWIYLDRKTPHRGGRRLEWVRSLKLFEYFRQYFPQILVKTAELPPHENYLLCVFPHGLLCTGAHAQFGSTNPQFERLFPGLRVSLHTLNLNFYFPFSREYILSIGFNSVSKEALVHELSGGRGRASVLVVGGSAEAMISSPGSHRVVLKNRKGFAKLSFTTGALLVPVYVFGETDLYRQKMFSSSSIFHKVQQAVRRLTGVAPVLPIGRGFSPHSVGLLPYAKPVHCVVGKPIPVERKENPSREEVEGLHRTFINELTQLFEKYKYYYLPNPESTFLSVED